jgi:phospholipid/cholesterol/gamma-HCH transport system substrate-binding protein
MVSQKVSNTLVGLTMIVALGLLMYGILLLGRTPNWGAARPYILTLTATNANNVAAGSKVDLNGVLIGSVKRVDLKKDPDGKLRVHAILQIDGNTDIPASATVILGRGQIGPSYVSISASDASGSMLAKNGSATLTAEAGDTGLIPKDVRDNLTAVSGQLEKVAADIHLLLAYNTPEAVEAARNDPTIKDKPVENVSTLVIRLNRTMGSLEKLLADPALHAQVRQIVQNLADSSAQLKTTLASVDSTFKNADKTVAKVGDAANQATTTLAASEKQILVVSEKLVDTLNQIEKTTRQLSEGNGTTGKLINDPRLYEGLVDLSKSMRSTVDDLDFLLKKWKDEGVNLKLK